MKKILIILVILGAMAAAAGCIIGVSARCLFTGGNNERTTKMIPAPEFHAINAARAVKVVISDKLSDQIRIEASDKIIDQVIVRSDAGELNITIDPIFIIGNTYVTVTVPANGQIRSLEAKSAAEIHSEVPLAAQKFNLGASSAARIEAAITATKCSIDASSASQIVADLSVGECEIKLSSASKAELKGFATDCSVKLSSGAKLEAHDFAVTDYTLDTASGSRAEINCTGTLHTDASSGSSIRYTGDCKGLLHMSSGASVRKN